MALVDALVAINAKLAEHSISAEIGAENLGKNAGWPKVVWVFVDGEGEYGRRMNGRTVDQPASIGTRLARVHAHLYARRNPTTLPLYQDYGALERLANRVLVSIREVCGPGSFQYEGESYPDAESGTQVHQAGRRAVLRGFFQVPVTPDDVSYDVWVPEEPEDLEEQVEMVATPEEL